MTAANKAGSSGADSTQAWTRSLDSIFFARVVNSVVFGSDHD